MKATGVVLILVILAGCDFTNQMSEMIALQNRAQQFVAENYQLDVKVGFNFVNGGLEQLTIYFAADDVRDRPIRELETITRRVAAEVFEDPPQGLSFMVRLI